MGPISMINDSGKEYCFIETIYQKETFSFMCDFFFGNGM